MENTIVDTVIHNFLSARGEGKEGEEKVEAWQGAWREAAGGGETQARYTGTEYTYYRHRVQKLYNICFYLVIFQHV